MGIGAAMITPATLSILTNVFTNPKERFRSHIASVYAGRIGDALAGQPITPAALKVAKDSLGGALAVAQQAGENGLGPLLTAAQSPPRR